MVDPRRRDEYVKEIMQILRENYSGKQLEALAEAGGVPNVCEAIQMKCQKRDDYDPAAFDEAVEQVDRDLRLGLAIT